YSSPPISPLALCSPCLPCATGRGRPSVPLPCCATKPGPARVPTSRCSSSCRPFSPCSAAPTAISHRPVDKSERRRNQGRGTFMQEELAKRRSAHFLHL